MQATSPGIATMMSGVGTVTPTDFDPVALDEQRLDDRRCAND